jgi:hypothetical protein
VKCWNISEDNEKVEICRKKNRTITDTIRRIVGNKNVKFIFNVGTYMFAGFDGDGIKYIIDDVSANDYSTWTMLIQGNPTAYFYNNNIVLFAINNEIYTYEKISSTELSSFKISETSFSNIITTIGYDNLTKKIFVGTDKGEVFESEIAYEKKPMKFIKRVVKNLDKPINDFIFRDLNNIYNNRNYILALSDEKIYQSDYEKILLKERIILDGYKISDMCKINGTLYIACENYNNKGGLYTLTDNSFSSSLTPDKKYGPTNSNIKKLVTIYKNKNNNGDYDKIFFIDTVDNYIRKVDQNGDIIRSDNQI